MLIDIANLYRKHPNPRRPFSMFFDSAGYTKAYTFLKETKKLPEQHIIIRAMPSRGHPSVAKVHPLLAVEFLRWLDYDKFGEAMLKFYEVD